jgi:Rrf2 family iron-sulfur cluster assembly transcriptional regulator
MKLSNAAAYAVHAMVRLANNAKVSPVTSKKLAEQRGMPERFLLQVLRDLSKYGILQATRGSTGGFTLAQRPDEIPLLEVIEAVEGPMIAALPTKDKFPDQTGKRLFDVLQGITDNARRELQVVRISDLVASNEAGEPRLKSGKSRKGQ